MYDGQEPRILTLFSTCEILGKKAYRRSLPDGDGVEHVRGEGHILEAEPVKLLDVVVLVDLIERETGVVQGVDQIWQQRDWEEKVGDGAEQQQSNGGVRVERRLLIQDDVHRVAHYGEQQQARECRQVQQTLFAALQVAYSK